MDNLSDMDICDINAVDKVVKKDGRNRVTNPLNQWDTKNTIRTTNGY